MLEKIKNFKLTYTQIIVLSFALVILTGTLLLCLPISSRTGDWTPWYNSFFTATSATCVTGLVVYDTYTHWNSFGQIVIIAMIQIGGLGLMTFITMFSVFMKRKVSLHERRILMQSAGTMRISGVIKLLKKIFIGTIIIEGIGMILFSIRFIPRMGIKEGIFNAIFHSISAFCNAGFDIMGKYGEFISMTQYVGDIIVNLTICTLIVLGGLGFFVWNDVVKNKFKFSKFELHTKIVLVTTFSLILTGWALFFIFERNGILADLSTKEKILATLFQSVTPRTAGFNTVDQAALSESGGILTIIFMFIGGSPGSTAGGIKTTTFLIAFIGTFVYAKNQSSVTLFKRRIDNDLVRQAYSIIFFYVMAVVLATLTICAIEPFRALEVVFEVVSAIGTVGLSMGITTKLCVASKLILAFLMFAGRVGGMSLVLFWAEKKEVIKLERPVEKILIG